MAPDSNPGFFSAFEATVHARESRSLSEVVPTLASARHAKTLNLTIVAYNMGEQSMWRYEEYNSGIMFWSLSIFKRSLLFFNNNSPKGLSITRGGRYSREAGPDHVLDAKRTGCLRI